MTPITVVIPTFNRLRDLERTLDALDRQTVAAAVIVVDNGSTDGTEEALRARAAGSERLRYLRISPSGPAGARNAGIERAETPYLAFVDSDVCLDPAWLERAGAALDANPGLPAVGGLLVYANEPEYANAYGGALSPLGLAWDVGEGEKAETFREAGSRLWINCSAMLARAAAVRAAGGFDGRFFYGFEDSDIGWRMAILHGPARVLPDLRATHHVGDAIGAAAPELVFHGSKNRLASLIANASLSRLAVFGPLYIGYACADLLLRAPRRPKLAALAWNLTNLRATLARRRSLAAPPGARRAAEKLFSRRLFPETRLGGMRRRPNRIQSRRNLIAADDRVHQ